MANYHSTLNLVASSPLIVVGQIASVRAEALDAGPFRGEQPQVATVKVRRVLKGQYDAPTLMVRSGPIASCSPLPTHYHFDQGSDLIFVLPSYPSKGQVRLAYGGSALVLDSFLMVEAKLERCKAYASDYLARTKRLEPNLLADGRRLAAKMRSTATTWPQLPDGKPTAAERKRFDQATRQLVLELRSFSIEAVRTAIAVDWLSDNPDLWLRKDLWESAMWELVRARGEEYAKAERQRLEQELVRIGEPADSRAKYIDTIGEHHFAARLTFPPNQAAIDSKASSSAVTTGFLLSFHAFDRGAMARLVHFKSTLAKLEAKRLQWVIRAMLKSDDSALQRVAKEVVRLSSEGASYRIEKKDWTRPLATPSKSTPQEHGRCADPWTPEQGADSCKPYLCIAGRCEQRCDYDSECQSDHQCRSHRCTLVAKVTATSKRTDTTGCGCALSESRRRLDSAKLLWLFALLLLRRKRPKLAS